MKTRIRTFCAAIVALFTTTFALSLCAAVSVEGDSVTLTCATTDNGNCNYGDNNAKFCITASDELPAGTMVKIDRITIAQAPDGNDNVQKIKFTIDGEDYVSETVDKTQGSWNWAGTGRVKRVYVFTDGPTIEVGTMYDSAVTWLNGSNGSVTPRFCATQDTNRFFGASANNNQYTPASILEGTIAKSEYETLTYDGFLTTTFVDTGWTLDLNKLEECVITGTMSGSSIANKPAPSNGYWAEVPDESGVAKFQMQVYQYNSASDHWLKAVEVELKQGDNGTVLIRGVRAGYADGGATDPKGSIKITDWNSTLATSATTQAYGVNKVVIKVPVSKETYTGKVISVNVTQGGTGYINADQTTPLGTFPANAWTQQSSEARGAGNAQKIDFSTAAEYNVNTGTKTDVSAKVFGIARDAGNFGRRDVAGDIAPATGYDYLYCWMSMKDGTQGTTYLNAEVPYETYDVYLYFSAHKVAQKSGGAAPAIRSFVIGGTHSSIDAEPTGGTRYTVDASGALVVSSDANATWGDGSIADVQVGKNYVVLENQSGAFSLLMNGSSGGLAAVQFAERTSGKKKVEVDCGTEYLMSDANAVEGDVITLKFADAGGTLLVDEAPSRKYTIKCAGKMEILGDDYTITQTDFNKLTLTQVSGGLTIDATGGLEMNDAVKSAIKAATSDKTYTFIGEGNKGVALDYGDSNNGTQLKTHIVFEGGAHTMKYRCESAGLKFGANATAENPTIRITDGATLTFAARNLCGWTSGNADANGIIRVDDGSKLVLNPVGGTLYWAQRLYLEPGAKLEFTDSGSNFRINGGTAEATAQIYVPASASDTTAKPAIIEQKGSSGIYANNQATAGFAIFVGENSKLQIDALLAQQNGDSPIVKRGAGALEVLRGISCNSFEVAAGSFACDETISALTIDAGATLDVSAGAPTVTNSLTLPETLNLAGEPTHGMTVLTVPNGYSLEGELPATFNARACAVYLDGGELKLKWKIPPTVIEIDPEADIETKPSVDYTASEVSVKVTYADRGDYAEDAMAYLIVIGENTYTGVASGEGDEKTVSFEIDELEGGKIYRGEFQVVYGEDRDVAATAPIVIRQGKLIYVEKDPWVNETPSTLKTTGSYDPESGVSVVGEMIQINSNKDVTFTPTPDPDYAAKCDSSFTISIMADEAIDDDDPSIDEGAQAGVKIVADGVGGAKFQFIAGEAWVDGPAAELNKLYEVSVSFHYAKDGGAEGDEDTVTYVVGEWTESYDRRADTADKVTEIIFTDGCQFSKLVGTCEIESADPVPQGLKPGEDTEIDADNDEDAKKKAAKIPVLIPDDELVLAALDTDAKKAAYKELFKVVAVKRGEKYFAEVVFTDDAEDKIEADEEGIVSAIVSAIGSLFGSEGELEAQNGQPGLYYGIATDGELDKMGEAEPEAWEIADKDGKIIGLKVKKSGKQDFYKVICTPTPND